MKYLIAFFLLLYPLILPAQTQPTVAEAEQFMKQAEERFNDYGIKAARAAWVQENFITEDTEALSADANDQVTAVITELAGQAKRFDGLTLPPELARKFLLLRLSLTAPAPKDPKLRKELTQIASSLDADYGKGKYCRKPDDCLDITAIERLMTTSHSPEELKDVWIGWHKVGAPMRAIQFTTERPADEPPRRQSAQVVFCLGRPQGRHVRQVQLGRHQDTKLRV